MKQHKILRNDQASRYPTLGRVLGESGAKSLELYRGIQDLWPSHITRLYNGEGVFGRGTYFAISHKDALSYALGLYNDHELHKFAFVVRYQANFKNLITLYEEDFEGLESASQRLVLIPSESGMEKLGYEHADYLKTERLGEDCREAGFDGVRLLADNNGVPDGGEQVLVPTGAKPKLTCLDFDVYFTNVKLANALRAQIKVGEVDDRYKGLLRIPIARAAEVEEFLAGLKKWPAAGSFPATARVVTSANRPGFTPPTKAEIVQILKKHPLIKLKEKVRRAFLVGSFAGGNPHDDSDVDILLEVEPHPDETAEQLAESYRRPLQQYFVTHNIRGKDDSVHPQWAGRRVDLYFTYDADQEDDRPKRELASLKEGNLMVLNKTKYPAIARVLAANESQAAPIDIETPRKNFGEAQQVAEKKIEEIKVKVRKDLEDFAKQYMQIDFHRANDKEGKDLKEYRFDSKKKKEVRNVYKLAIEEHHGKPDQPGNPKGHDEGSVTLYSKSGTLAPGVDHEELEIDKKNQRSYERNKAIWIRIGFSWEETQDPQNPKIFWWEGIPQIIKDPVKEDYYVKRKHEFKDYAEIEKYMANRVNTDEIIKDTSEQHIAGIREKVAPVLGQVRNILKPFEGMPLKFANFPKPIKLELEENESDITGEDPTFSFYVWARPGKAGYEKFKVFQVNIQVGTGKFHTPYDFKDFGQYFDSDFEITWDSDDGDVYSRIAEPDFSKLNELVAEVKQKMKRKVPVLQVDEDEIEEEPKQLEAPEEESA